MDFILFVGEFEVIDKIHVLQDAHFLERGGDAAIIFIIEIIRKREFRVTEQFQITQIRHPRPVGSLVVDKKAERTVFVALLIKPLQRKVGDDVRSIAFPAHPLAVTDKSRIVIVSLPYKNIPVIEPGRIRDQMPLPYHRCLVAGSLEDFRECLLPSVKGCGVVGEAIGVAMLSRQHTSPARAAKRVRHETVRETCPLVRDAVDVRCPDEAAVIGTDCLIRVVIAHDVDDIQSLSLTIPVIFP